VPRNGRPTPPLRPPRASNLTSVLGFRVSGLTRRTMAGRAGDESCGTGLASVAAGSSCDAKMSEENDNEPSEGATRRPGGGVVGKLLPSVLLLNTALIGGVLVLVMKRPAVVAPASARMIEAAESESSREPPGPLLKLEDFVIQLKAVDTDRYVRLAFDLELGSEADREVVGARLSRIRDIVISYFADRTIDELRGSQAMERTKALLAKRIDEVVPGRRIRNIFITDFIVQ
jgi:flagellar FliL protein